MPQDTHSTKEGRARAVLFALAIATAAGSTARAQQAPTAPGTVGSPPMNTGGAPQASEATPTEMRGKMLDVPINTLVPGAVSVNPQIKSPVKPDPAAAQRGMRAFIAFNCVGCHMPHGGGGMGPALSNQFFVYGSQPEQIYLTIVQGRPRGMPAWGSVLPDEVIWDLVAYIQNLSNAPSTEWGQTFSTEALKIQQVPAENVQTENPWQFTEPFSSGQKPAGG
jgi:cytochrome c oxidase cbb3-type subunit III